MYQQFESDDAQTEIVSTEHAQAPETFDELRYLTRQHNSLTDMSTEKINVKDKLTEATTKQKKPELSAEGISNASSDQLLLLTQLIADISITSTEASDGNLTSDAENMAEEATVFSPLEQETINTEPEECILAESLTSQSSVSDAELTLESNELTLLEKIDMSGYLSEDCTTSCEIHIEERLRALILRKESWDVEVRIGDTKFYCQHVVLHLYSPYFLLSKLENKDKIRLPEEMVTPQAFNIIYKWMLSENPSLTKNISNRSLLEIYKAAKFLGVSEIVNFICCALDSVKNDNDGFSLLADLASLNMQDFECLYLSRISKFFLTLVSSREFVEMPLEYVSHLLGSHNVGVNSEIEVFYSLVRWVSHEWPKRSTHVVKLMSCIRFTLLPPVFLHYLQNPQNTQVMHYVNSVQKVKDMINLAFVYTSVERYCKDRPEQLMLQLPNCGVPEPRRWLIDSKCPYHHNFNCIHRQFFTYEQFLGYLEMLHYMKPNYWKELNYVNDATNCCPR